MLSSVLDLMNQSICVRRTLPDSSVYHTSGLVYTQDFPARIEVNISHTIGKDGTLIPTYATIFTIGEIESNDEIVLPDGTVRHVLSVMKAVDSSGIFSHSVVTI